MATAGQVPRQFNTLLSETRPSQLDFVCVHSTSVRVTICFGNCVCYFVWIHTPNSFFPLTCQLCSCRCFVCVRLCRRELLRRLIRLDCGPELSFHGSESDLTGSYEVNLDGKLTLCDASSLRCRIVQPAPSCRLVKSPRCRLGWSQILGNVW